MEILHKILSDNGLRVTPQRIAVLEAIKRLANHPAAEKIIEFVRINHPNISSGTIYKTLDTFVDAGLLKRVKTDRDVMRYDAMTHSHHHLYCADSDRIEDYNDDELNALLADYFAKRKIPGFSIDDIKLQIIGKFSEAKGL